MRLNAKVVDIVRLQQERRLRIEQAERELAAKTERVHAADILFWWMIAGCLATAAVIVVGVEQGWW